MHSRITLCFIFCSVLALPLFAQGVPPVPQNLTATVLMDGPAVELKWEAPRGLWAFQIYRAQWSSDFAAVGSSIGRMFIDNDVLPDNVYRYQVRSVMRSNGTLVESEPSGVVEAAIGSIKNKGVIQGIVTDAENGRPIKNVGIKLTPVKDPLTWLVLATDAEGRYQATLDFGTYVVQVSPPLFSGYLGADHKTVVIAEGAVVSLDFVLGRETTTDPGKQGEISGTVIDEKSNQPVANVIIRFYNSEANPNWQAYVTTDSEGRYRATLDVGEYKVAAQPPTGTITSPGYLPEWYNDARRREDATPVQISVDSPATVDFALTPIELSSTAMVQGTVRDSEGNPVAGADVLFLDTQRGVAGIGAALVGHSRGLGRVLINSGWIVCCRDAAWKGITDDSGHYSAVVSKDNSYYVVVAKAGYGAAYYNNKLSADKADVLEVAGDTSGIDFTLSRQAEAIGKVSGSVKDRTGKGVVSTILFFPYGNTPLQRSVLGRTDSNGIFSVDGLTPGIYAILAVPDWEYAPAFYNAETGGDWRSASLVDVEREVSGIDILVSPSGIRRSGIGRGIR